VRVPDRLARDSPVELRPAPLPGRLPPVCRLSYGTRPNLLAWGQICFEDGRDAAVRAAAAPTTHKRQFPATARPAQGFSSRDGRLHRQTRHLTTPATGFLRFFAAARSPARSHPMCPVGGPPCFHSDGCLLPHRRSLIPPRLARGQAASRNRITHRLSRIAPHSSLTDSTRSATRIRQSPS
jgi:hypothetical protein